MDGIYRDIVEDPLFEQAAREIIPAARRWDELTVAIYWAIARNPEHFPTVARGSNLRLVLTKPYRELPALRILFEVESEGRCVLRYVAIDPDPVESSGIG